MNDKEFQTLYAHLVSGAGAIIDGKHHDYADTDRLSAFKKASELWSKLTGKSMYPFEAALFLELLKLVRYVNLYEKCGNPKNESFSNNVVDGINYWALMEACRVES